MPLPCQVFGTTAERTGPWAARACQQRSPAQSKELSDHHQHSRSQSSSIRAYGLPSRAAILGNSTPRSWMQTGLVQIPCCLCPPAQCLCSHSHPVHILFNQPHQVCSTLCDLSKTHDKNASGPSLMSLDIRMSRSSLACQPRSLTGSPSRRGSLVSNYGNEVGPRLDCRRNRVGTFTSHSSTAKEEHEVSRYGEVGGIAAALVGGRITNRFAILDSDLPSLALHRDAGRKTRKVCHSPRCVKNTRMLNLSCGTHCSCESSNPLRKNG